MNLFEKMSSLLIMKFINESIYWQGTENLQLFKSTSTRGSGLCTRHNSVDFLL